MAADFAFIGEWQRFLRTRRTGEEFSTVVWDGALSMIEPP
jgi:hypothetical protein